MKRYMWILTLALPMLSVAQAAKLRMPDFDGLASRATESVNITLDGAMLKAAGGFMGSGKGNGPADAEAAELVKGLDGIYIRVFTFDKPNMYSPRDVDPVLQQTKAPGWKSMMSIRKKDENLEMWMHEHDAGGGFLLVVTKPEQLVIINIVGDIDLEKLSKLQGRMGVPMLPPGLPAASTAPRAPATGETVN
jgi:hypothetical protein